MFGVRLSGDCRGPELDEKHEVIRAAASDPASSLMPPLSTPEETSTGLYAALDSGQGDAERTFSLDR
jgi:hypothetical protein